MIFIRNGQHAEASYMLRGGGWKGEREREREREEGVGVGVGENGKWIHVEPFLLIFWRSGAGYGCVDIEEGGGIGKVSDGVGLLLHCLWVDNLQSLVGSKSKPKKKRQPQNQSNDSRRKETGGGLLPVKVWKPQRRPCRPLGVWRWWCRRTPAGVADSAAAFWKCELWFSRRLWGRGFFRAHLCPLFRECSPNLLGRRLLQSVGIVVSMDITETAKIQLKIEDLPVRTSCDSAASSFRSERSAPSYGGRVCRLASYEEPPEERPEAWWLSREVALAGGPVCVRPPHARIVR